MDLGPVGLWTGQLDAQPWAAAAEAIAEVDDLGYAAVWIPEAVGRDPFVHAALLLDASRRLVVATGIASIYARDPVAMNAAWKSLSEAHPGRFLLGLGISHASMVEGLRGHAYGPPLTTMRTYLDAVDAALYLAAAPAETHRVLAALGPKMLALAADRTDGAHPYLVTPDHTRRAREILGPDRLLAPEQKAVLTTDADEARRIARGALAIYLDLPNYRRNLHRLGFDDAEIDGGGSDRLVDALVVHGDEEAIARRVAEHRDAGADHVAVQVLPADPAALPLEEWRRLAPALTG